MPALRLTAQAPPFPSWHRIWLYISVLCVTGLLTLVSLTILPLAAQSRTIPIGPLVPQAEPDLGTTSLVAELNMQNLGAKALGYVTHPYLTGRGKLLSFAGDNIQIFEYPTSDIAHKEAWAIFNRAPRLTAKDYFHIFLRDNLIGLYFGHNTVVLTATEEQMGYPLKTLVSP